MSPPLRSLHGVHHVEHVMGMAVSIDIRDPLCAPEVIADTVGWLHHVDATFGTHMADSPISKLGRGDIMLNEIPDAAGDEIRQVLELCEMVKSQTGGVFDVFEVPAPNGTRLDPSGLVKGWAIERSAALLEAYGCENFCINAGGDIAVRGHRERSEPWKIGIRHPHDPQALALVVEAAGRLGVATSATYERGDHIIDPRTRRSTMPLASVTVTGPDLTLADAYATAVFVMGDEGIDWIEDCAGYDAYVIDLNDQTRWSTGFPHQ